MIKGTIYEKDYDYEYDGNIHKLLYLMSKVSYLEVCKRNIYKDNGYLLVKNFKEMLADFEKTALIGLAIDAGFISLPKYIYYDIISIDESIKPIILGHLKASMIGYTDIDYNDNDKKQLKVWLEYLSASD